jgi:uroporphyrinogen-III synthase
MPAARSNSAPVPDFSREKRLRLAVTRPWTDGERTAAALRERGHDVLLAPLLRVEPVAADLSGAGSENWAGVIVTSANALRATDGKLGALRSLPLYAVGARTAEVARAAGFKTVHVADGDARALVALVAAQAATMAGSLLYLAAEQRAADLEAELKPHGVTVVTRIVYRTLALPLPAELADALRGGRNDAVLHYSRRSAEAFLAGASVTGLNAQALAPRHLCLSEQVAAPLAAAGADNVAIAGAPDESAMISLIGSA